MIKLLKKLIIYLFIYVINITNSYKKKNKSIVPKISIFLPIYNKELYIKKCFFSLQKQTFKNIELIAINDGSTDNSLKILKKLSKKDKRIKIINNDRNHGLLYSRAMGVLNSKGEYLMNIDPDDKLMSKNDIKFLYKFSKTKKYDIIIFLIKRIPTNKSDIKHFEYFNKNQLNMTDFYITNKLIKKEVFIKAFHEFNKEIFDERWNYHEDNIWNLLVRKNAKSIKILYKFIYSYKRNKHSLGFETDNAMEIKNRFDKLKIFKKSNFIISIGYLLFYIIKNFKHYNGIKNNKLKNYIFYILINYMNFIGEKNIIYKAMNLFLNKLSPGKLIIFFDSSIQNNNLNSKESTIFRDIIKKFRNIISINCNQTQNIKDINDFTFSNDVIMFLNNLIFKTKLKKFLKAHKKNKIIAFINKKKNIKKLHEYKNIKIFFSNN